MPVDARAKRAEQVEDEADDDEEDTDVEEERADELDVPEHRDVALDDEGLTVPKRTAGRFVATDDTALRTLRQEDARAAGDRTLAREIGALPKPTAAAWVFFTSLLRAAPAGSSLLGGDR